MPNFFYRDKADREIGPFDLATLEKFKLAGILKDDTLIRREESNEWITYHNCQFEVKRLLFSDVKQPTNHKKPNMVYPMLIITAGAIIFAAWYFGGGAPIAGNANKQSENTAKDTSITDTLYVNQSILESAKMGHAKAQYDLGVRYLTGVGMVEKDESEALAWFQKSANQGYSLGQNALGNMYESGIGGLPRDHQEAVKWYQKAANQGCGKAIANLGRAYLYGLGVEKDTAKGIDLLQKLANEGDQYGEFYLGISYVDGIGVEKDLGKAFDLIKKSAMHGCDQAQARLGDFYERGLIVGSVNKNEAVKWYTLAAKSGNALAITRLHVLNPSPEDKAKMEKIACVNNLKEIGLAFKIWEGDNNDRYPYNVSSNYGGSMEYCDRTQEGWDKNSFHHFQVMSNELTTPKILICPSDTKQPSLSFAHLYSQNVTYLIHSGTNVTDAYPDEVLAYCPIHNVVLFTDGSVKQMTEKPKVSP